MCFDPVAVVYVVTMGQSICTFMTNFLQGSYLFDSIFSEILPTDKLHYFYEGIYFPNNGYHGNSKKAISQLS